jgi:protein SCO1/2
MLPLANGRVVLWQRTHRIVQDCLCLLALIFSGTAFTDDGLCWRSFHQLAADRQLACLAGNNVPSATVLVQLLSVSDSATDHRVLGGLLERIRVAKPAVPATAEALANFLPHQHSIYEDRDRWHVVRLRAYLIATLTDVGFPALAMPTLADSLFFTDERMAPVEVGSAVRAAGALGDDGRRFLPSMLRLLSMRFADEEFSLSRYDTNFPRLESTTVQLEVLRAVGRIGRSTDNEVLLTLRAIVDSPKFSPLDSRVIYAAQLALRQVEGRTGHETLARRVPTSSDVDITAWQSPAKRIKIDLQRIHITDHSGVHRLLGEIVDRPVLLSFFYTRCQNAGKCSLTISQLGFLQRALSEAGETSKIRLLAITFEPEFDTPERLRRFVQDRGMILSEYALTARIHEADHEAFVRALDMPVSYNAGWVNTHGVEAVLLDAAGRVARKYRADSWRFERLSADLARLELGE